MYECWRLSVLTYMSKWFYQNGVRADSQNLKMSSSVNLTLFQWNVITLILGPGKWLSDTGWRLLRCSLLAILGSCTHHLMSYALDGRKSFVPKFWNSVRTFCCASCSFAETRGCIVRTLLILCLDGGTASYLGSSGLLKIRCSIQVICTHLVNCHLNCVRKSLNRNSKVWKRLLDGSGSDYVHWWRLKEQQSVVLNLCQN